MNADADIEPLKLTNRDAGKVFLLKANVGDEQGALVPWPQTLTRLALMDPSNKDFVYKLKALFLERNTWFFDGFWSISPFFASFGKDELCHFNHIVVDSRFASMDSNIHMSTSTVLDSMQEWGGFDDIIFIRSLGKNLKFTVLLAEPIVNNYYTNQATATDEFINKLLCLHSFIKYCPGDYPIWTNLEGFEVAIHLNHNNNDRFVLHKGVTIPADSAVKSLSDSRVVWHIEQLVDVLYYRKTQKLHETIEFTPTDDELAGAYLYSGLPTNDLEQSQCSRSADGDPETMSS
ncbi:hypothetical protein PG988_003826 [Apiospora saccharicola]